MLEVRQDPALQSLEGLLKAHAETFMMMGEFEEVVKGTPCLDYGLLLAVMQFVLAVPGCRTEMDSGGHE